MVNILVFKVGGICFGIETAYVNSIAKNLEWGKEARRIINVFSDEKTDACRQIEFVEVSFKGDVCVIPIDEVIDIFQVLEKDILPIPAFALRHMAKNFFQGVFDVGEKLVLILDVRKLLHNGNF